ncbi:MAG TPA: hypothetical protein VIM75_14000 [Ohtaekwangia sp.]|uniref:hypothetical protein n=1 Tax=Ohtaekwangia sp. TaxID=2066019 RepID=UPI002F937064
MMRNFVNPMRATRIFLMLILLTAVNFSLHAQQDRARAEEFAREMEQARKAALMRELDSGVYYMDNGEYKKADEIFRHVLATVKSVPSDLTYYFGKNSFHLGLYKQSIDWLNKYIQLKGTNGQYSQEAIQWKKQAENEFLKEKENEASKAQQILSQNYDIDCGPSGKVVCPACKGDHVIIRRGAFGDEYKTCPYCNEQGILTCQEYNLLLRGKLQPRNQ